MDDTFKPRGAIRLSACFTVTECAKDAAKMSDKGSFNTSLSPTTPKDTAVWETAKNMPPEYITPEMRDHRGRFYSSYSRSGQYTASELIRWVLLLIIFLYLQQVCQIQGVKNCSVPAFPVEASREPSRPSEKIYWLGTKTIQYFYSCLFKSIVMLAMSTVISLQVFWFWAEHFPDFNLHCAFQVDTVKQVSHWLGRQELD